MLGDNLPTCVRFNWIATFSSFTSLKLDRFSANFLKIHPWIIQLFQRWSSSSKNQKTFVDKISINLVTIMMLLYLEFFLCKDYFWKGLKITIYKSIIDKIYLLKNILSFNLLTNNFLIFLLFEKCLSLCTYFSFSNYLAFLVFNLFQLRNISIKVFRFNFIS